MILTRQNTGRRRSIAACLILAGMLPLAACDQRSEVTDAIDNAGRTLREFRIGATVAGQDPGLRGDEYRSVVQGLDAVMSKADPEQVETVATMLAEAHAGLGQIISEQASALERQSERKTALIRGAQDRWEYFNGLAAALESQDASEQLAEIDALLEIRAAESVEARRQEEQVDRGIASLRAQIADADTMARREWERESMLRQDAIDQSQTRRAELIVAARTYKRAGDGFDRQAQLLRAEMGRLEPSRKDIVSLRERLEAQTEMLNNAREELSGLLEQRIEQARGLRTDAGEVAGEIAELTSQLRAQREQVPALWDSALQAYDKALSNARRGAQRFARADYERARAEALLGKAHGISSSASIFKVLADSPHALPADYGQVAQQLGAEAEAATAAAREAYRQVSVSLEGAPPELRDRLNGLRARLVSLGGEAPASDEPGDGMDDQGSDETGAGDAASADGVDPQVAALVDEMVDALNAQDLQRFRDMFAGPARELELFDRFMPLAESFGNLERACQDTFGTSLIDAARNVPGPAGHMFAGMQIPTVNRSDVRIVMVSADEAEADLGGGSGEGMLSQSVLFSREGGDWIARMSALPESAQAESDMMAGMVGPMTRVFSSIADDVSAGSFDSIQQAMQAIMLQMGEATGMGGAGGPGGG